MNPNFKSKPSVNADDLFMPKLASGTEGSPETETLPSPIVNVTAPYKVGKSRGYRGPLNKSPPPDVPSMFLEDRIVYICEPFWPEVTELVIAQLMYLESKDPDEPITLYIDSSGSKTEDGETVARETEGFAMYDALMQLRCEIRTMAFGEAMGPACLLLAAGTKGKRFIFPHAIAGVEEPAVPATGLMPASYVGLLTKEVLTQRDILVELLAKHSGQSVETIKKDIKKGLFWVGEEAVKYGIADKVLPPRQKKGGRLQKKLMKQKQEEELASTSQ